MHCGITVCRLGRVLVTTSFHDEAFLFPIGAQRVAQCNSKIQGLPQTKYVTFFSETVFREHCPPRRHRMLKLQIPSSQMSSDAKVADALVADAIVADAIGC